MFHLTLKNKFSSKYQKLILTNVYIYGESQRNVYNKMWNVKCVAAGETQAVCISLELILTLGLCADRYF